MRRIIRTKKRFTEVTAVPGSGKTTTAVARVRHLLQNDPAVRIQVLSSTNATVINFKQRLQAAGIDVEADKGGKVDVSTIHSLFFALIRRHHLRLGYPVAPAVVDPARKAKLLEQINSGRGTATAVRTATRKGSGRRSIVPRTSMGKLTAQQAYQDHKRSSNTIDYDDMLRLGDKLMSRLSRKELGIDHLIVDEWQDCTPVQIQLIAALARRVKTTVVLGDRLQMIYGFAGGRYTPLRRALLDAGFRLGKDELVERTLRRSYRLTAQIAGLAMAVAAPLDPPTIKTGKTGKMPRVIEAADTRALANKLAKRVQKLLRNGVSPSQIALLGRTRAVLHPVAQELAARKVATQLAGSDNHYPAVLDVLWLADKFEELRDYGAGLDTSARGRCAQVTREMETEMRERLGVDDQDEQAVRPKPERWKRFVKEFINIPGGKTLEGAYKACVRVYLRLHGGVNANKELRNALNRWEPLSRRFACAAEMGAYVQRIAGAESIACSTIHASKGMEWDYVFMVGVTDGVLPDRRSIRQEQLDEERRVLYVGLTRARKRLWLGHSPVKVSGVKREYSKMSRFLREAGVKSAIKTANSTPTKPCKPT